jgi:hypothetical protein
VPRNLDITQIFILILIEIALAGKAEVVIAGETVDSLDNIALESRALLPGVSHDPSLGEKFLEIQSRKGYL